MPQPSPHSPAICISTFKRHLSLHGQQVCMVSTSSMSAARITTLDSTSTITSAENVTGNLWRTDYTAAMTLKIGNITEPKKCQPGLDATHQQYSASQWLQRVRDHEEMKELSSAPTLCVMTCLLSHSQLLSDVWSYLGTCHSFTLNICWVKFN